tara:strand:- start:816 stop:1178 length:363 start_codon:yes stop_codon:yes gene_type:complete
MDELTYKDLTSPELEALKDIYVARRVSSMTESELRSFVREIIADQIKGTVGNTEEKEAWQEMKKYFTGDFPDLIEEVRNKNSKNSNSEYKSPEEIEFDKRLSLLKQQHSDESNNDMWEDD